MTAGKKAERELREDEIHEQAYCFAVFVKDWMHWIQLENYATREEALKVMAEMETGTRGALRVRRIPKGKPAHPLMLCGHVANALRRDQPICGVCAATHPGGGEWRTPAPVPDLKGRSAACRECSNATYSSIHLPFFEYRSEEKTDHFYCGCKGW